MTHRWLAEMTTSVATRAPPREALAGTATRHSGMADRGGARGGRRAPARAFLEPARKGWGRVAAGTTVRRPAATQRARRRHNKTKDLVMADPSAPNRCRAEDQVRPVASPKM
jgi:hypothetical protein